MHRFGLFIGTWITVRDYKYIRLDYWIIPGGWIKQHGGHCTWYNAINAVKTSLMCEGFSNLDTRVGIRRCESLSAIRMALYMVTRPTREQPPPSPKPHQTEFPWPRGVTECEPVSPLPPALIFRPVILRLGRVCSPFWGWLKPNLLAAQRLISEVTVI